MSKVEELLKLKRLLDSGLINEKDFEKLKENIFSNNIDLLPPKEEERKTIKSGYFCSVCNEIHDENETCKDSYLKLDASINFDNNKNTKTIGYIIMLLSLLIIAMIIYLNFDDTKNQMPYQNTIKQTDDKLNEEPVKTTTLIDTVNKLESNKSIIDSSDINYNDNRTSNIALQDVKDLMTNYYQDICNGNFDVNNYYAYHVNQFINLENIYAKDIDYQINTIAKKEFRDTKINIISDIKETNSNDEFRYYKFSIEFEAFRVSKNKMTNCNVDIEIGLNQNNKITSYKELKYYNYKSY